MLLLHAELNSLINLIRPTRFANLSLVKSYWMVCFICSLYTWHSMYYLALFWCLLIDCFILPDKTDKSLNDFILKRTWEPNTKSGWTSMERFTVTTTWKREIFCLISGWKQLTVQRKLTLTLQKVFFTLQRFPFKVRYLCNFADVRFCYYKCALKYWQKKV